MIGDLGTAFFLACIKKEKTVNPDHVRLSSIPPFLKWGCPEQSVRPLNLQFIAELA
jgi:hypothetical protein